MACPFCGAPHPATARFCDQCGTPLERAPEPDEPIEPGDRRIVSAVFADLVDYSGMVARDDPEDVRRRVDGAFAELAAAVDRYGGSVEKFIGDAVFAVFGSPLARDDDAVRAALCAVAMRDALRPRDRRDEGSRLRLRIGIATGEVVSAPRDIAGQRGAVFTGVAITTAARLQQYALPDEILVDPQTVETARGRLLVEPLRRPRPRRGIDGRRRSTGGARALDPAPAGLRLVDVRPVPAVGPGDRFIGRRHERAVLLDALRAVQRTGRARTVLLVGEPGMGKTRLLADLEADVRRAGFRWTWTENLSFRAGEPYGHVRLFAERVADEMGTDPGSLARALLFGPNVAPDEIARMAGAIAAIARDAAFSGWEQEQDLVPVDLAELRAGLREVSDRYVRTLAAARGPRVVVIDDLQWQDASSRPLTDDLVGMTDVPLLILAASRPGIERVWLGDAHVSVVRLSGLDAEETGALAEAVAGAGLAPDDAARLHARTDGNPLFIRETVRVALTDDEPIRDGRLVLRTSGPGRLPVSLRAVLGARIDALPSLDRAALQVASVSGASFDQALVERVLAADRRKASASGTGGAVFAALAAAGLLKEADLPGRWQFAHVLLHEVTYGSLLASRRRRLHGLVATELEADGGSGDVGLLAAHWLNAGNGARAHPLFLVAAEEAAAIGAVAEAIGFYEQAAAIAPTDLARSAAREAIAALRPAVPAST